MDTTNRLSAPILSGMCRDCFFSVWSRATVARSCAVPDEDGEARGR